MNDGAFLIGAGIIITAIFGMAYSETNETKSDAIFIKEKISNTGIYLLTDKLNGCEYLMSESITPRLDFTGNQMGCKIINN